MSLINLTYFFGPINVPNVDNPSIAEQLTDAISVYEQQLLSTILGQKLYGDFITGLAEGSPDQKWLDLRDGKVFYGEKKYWQGMIVDYGDDNKQSLIALYVYYWYMREHATTTTGVGETNPKTSNASRINNIPKMVRAWNDMSKWAWNLYCYLEYNKTTYDWEPACNLCNDDVFHRINEFNI